MFVDLEKPYCRIFVLSWLEFSVSSKNIPTKEIVAQVETIVKISQ